MIEVQPAAAKELCRVKPPGPGPAQRVKSRLLVAVLAVLQVRHLPEAQHHFVVEQAAGFRKVLGYGGVVGGQVLPGPRRQLFLDRGLQAAGFPQRAQHRPVVHRARKGDDVLEIFGRGPEHGRIGLVQVIGKLGDAEFLLFHKVGYRIKVGRHHVEGGKLHAVLGDRREAAGKGFEHARRHRRGVADIFRLYPGFLEQLEGGPGGVERKPELVKAAGEVLHARLVVYAQVGRLVHEA